MDAENYPLTRATLRDRTVGIVGMGAIEARRSARQLDAGVPVAYLTLASGPELRYRHYPKLIDMARDADVLMVIVPGARRRRT